MTNIFNYFKNHKELKVLGYSLLLAITIVLVMYGFNKSYFVVLVEKLENSMVIRTRSLEQVKELIKEPKEVNRDVIADYILHKNRKSYPQLAKLIVETTLRMEEKYNIPYEYLLALIQIESSFKTDTVSSKDCIGLTQINYKVWIDDKANKHSLVKNNILKTKRELYYPVKNIMAGAFILNHYISIGKDKQESRPIKYGVMKYHGAGEKAIKHYNKFESALGEFLVFRNTKESKHKLVKSREKEDD